MNQDVLLYFRTVADEDNDDNNGAQTSCCFPASKLRGMSPTSDTALTLYFDSMKNTEGADNQADEITIADSVVLTISSNQAREVMNGIVRAINGNTTGLVVVADDVTTNVAGSTVAATYIHADITGIATDDINCVAVHAGS